jgi:hypothetical protein
MNARGRGSGNGCSGQGALGEGVLARAASSFASLNLDNVVRKGV